MERNDFHEIYEMIKCTAITFVMLCKDSWMMFDVLG